MTDSATHEWITAVQFELGLEDATDSDTGLDALGGLATTVGGRVGSDAIARTAFLVGVAAGRAEEPAVAARDYAQKLSALAEGWDSEAQRGVPSNDPDHRG
jgi:hypothetical protein